MILKKSTSTGLKLVFLFLLILHLGCISNRFRELHPIEKDGLWGYENAKKEVVIPSEFIVAMEFNKGGIAAVIDEKGWVYINIKGEKIIKPFVVDNGPDYFSEGLSRFVDNGKFGFFDEKGKIKINPLFDYASPFSEGLSAVCKGCTESKEGEHSFYAGGKWGYINKKGYIVIDYLFDSANTLNMTKSW
ncbi:WG repeat-containing protein [bacterium]|nr:WG repeat-containing protein [bacterium]